MKKIFLLVFIFSFLLTSCGKSTQSESLQEVWQLLDVETNIAQAAKTLEDIWYTWDELAQQIQEQREIYTEIANFTWENKSFYLMQTQLMPELVKSPKAKDCKDKQDVNFFIECMIENWINLSDIVSSVPWNLQDDFKKKYYYAFYEDNSNLLEKTEDKIAIEVKKDLISSFVLEWSISKESECKQIPESEVQQFCVDSLEK